MRINEHGFWENETAEGHEHDEGLANALAEFFIKEKGDKRITNVMDIGCGDGYYTKFLNDYKSFTIICHGFDGNPNTVQLAGPNSFVMDFSKPTLLSEDHKYDWVLCLEVGEHIPAEYEDVFIKNIDKHNRYGVVLSWAVPGQGGDGHINCRPNAEIMHKMKDMGYYLDVVETPKLRKACAEYPKPCYWFRDTLMVFRRG